MSEQLKDCHACHRSGYRGFVGSGDYGWLCSNEVACMRRERDQARADLAETSGAYNAAAVEVVRLRADLADAQRQRDALRNELDHALSMGEILTRRVDAVLELCENTIMVNLAWRVVRVHDVAAALSAGGGGQLGECSCGTTGLTYEGPQRDCPIHGESAGGGDPTGELTDADGEPKVGV